MGAIDLLYILGIVSILLRREVQRGVGNGSPPTGSRGRAAVGSGTFDHSVRKFSDA